MTSLHPDTFNKEAFKPAQLDAPAYQAILEKLLAQGEGWGKNKQVGAYLLEKLEFETQTSDGRVETRNSVDFEKKMYIVMDTDQYPTEYLRNLVIQDITKKWGGKLIKERDLSEPEFSGPGLWLLKKGNFEGDYQPSATGANTYEPNPAAYRVTLTVDQPVNIPVQWAGGFFVAKGGDLAIRQKDVPALAEALQSIRSGAATAEDALFTTDAKSGEKVAKFDIYGMEPKFRENNYAPVPLYPETEAAMGAFKAKPAKPAKGLTNG
ncbi:MAG TPA: hypothetical protein VEF76_03820 [Patescibacteria group bacterium]|nr:hypothetical protein [Patescibacteria group bacterium]